MTYRERISNPAAPCFIVAEIGVNHEGSADSCALMIEEAARAGADAIKLQTMDADENYLPETESHRIFSQAALTRDETARMFGLAREVGIEPFTTVGDRYTLGWLLTLDPCALKISSGLLTHLPLIREAAATGYPLIMSTGMARDEQVEAAVAAAREGGAQHTALLHCTSIYPAGKEQLHLSRIAWLRERYGVVVGYSDHDTGVDAAVLSIAAGARIVEKHFSLTPRRAGFDHPLSLDPRQFAEMVRRIREAETMLGKPDRELDDTEKENARRFHRILVARRTVTAGASLAIDDIGFRRPPPGLTGLPPADYDQVLGRTLRAGLQENQPITMDNLEPVP